MPHFAKSRFFSCSHTFKAFPFYPQQMGMASVADTLYNHLHNTNNVTVERSLSQVVKPNLDSTSVIQVMARCYPKDPQLGLRFFVWAGSQSQSGYRHSPYMYKKACNLLGIGKDPRVFHGLIESYQAEGCFLTANMFREVLKLCSEARLNDVALWLLTKMEAFNLNPDTVMYNVVIRLCCKKGDVETAEKLMREMRSGGLCPDVITYMAIIEGFCEAGRPEDAYSVLGVMRLNGCSISSVVLSATLDGFCRSGSMERALELLDEMEKEGGSCRPNVVTYTSLIQSLCKGGRWAEALGILDRMKAFGCLANHVTAFTLVESLCAKGFVEEAYRLVDKLVVEHGVSYSQCYSSLVISLIRIKKIEEAEKLFREMLAGEIKPDTFSCNLLLKELCLMDRVPDGFCLLDTIDKMGYLSCIDADIYTTLLVGLCQRSQLMEATKLARIMIKKSVRLQPRYQDIVIDILSNHGEEDLVNQLIGMNKGLR